MICTTYPISAVTFRSTFGSLQLRVVRVDSPRFIFIVSMSIEVSFNFLKLKKKSQGTRFGEYVMGGGKGTEVQLKFVDRPETHGSDKTK